MPRSIKGLHHVALSVSNLERSIAFYKEFFGFEEEKRFERQDLKGKAAMLTLGDMRLEIWEFEDGVAPQDDLANLKVRGLRHIAFAVQDINAAYESLKSKVKVSAVQTGASGGRYCFVTDPDGVQIELYQPQ
jgi:catechol 2,3-dioxygenase-like lactoylglutathione lyase family enzyme